MTAPSLLCDQIVGLFTLEDLKENEFIIEYTGEIFDGECLFKDYLNNVNDSLGRSYGFDLQEDMAVDAINCGNLMRFANHADKKYANCKVKLCFARGTVRVALIASKFINAGEELHFDYMFQQKLDWLQGYNTKYVNPFTKGK